MSNPVIQLKEVSKFYNIYKNRPTTFKEKILNLFKGESRKEQVIQKKVLENFSFDIYAGDTVGIIGENGAGKSTTLKLIANIIQPDNGTINVLGTVASLLEIGAGFQPDMTGTENVYLYGTILGLSKKYINKQFDHIVQFAELEDFMNMPVKNYSSGMYMRLAFSVAIHVNPDIILIDEVLAVGDVNFQKKCLSKLEDFQDKGKTIIFVSHDMGSVRKLCNKVVYIYDNGKYEIGLPDQMVNLYFSRIYNNHVMNTIDVKDNNEIETGNKEIALMSEGTDRARWGNFKAKINEVYLGTREGLASHIFEPGSDIVINVKVTSEELIERAVLGIAIYDEDNHLLCGPNSKDDGRIIEIIQGDIFLKVIIKNSALLEGNYLLSVALYDYNCREPFDHLEKYFEFRVNNTTQIIGKFKLNCEWIF